MDTLRGGARQQVPQDFADRLRALNGAEPPVLGALLVACRKAGWSAPALAAGLDMNPPAVSKWIERTRARTAAAAAAAQLLAGDGALDPDQRTEAEQLVLRQQAIDAALQRELAQTPIPQPEKINSMINGQRLSAEKIAELKAMQAVASRVNGALPVGHPQRKIGQAYSDELHRLVDKEHYSSYYLARVLGVSHRAITSRLERYGHREPPPSVAGTASGHYYGRKIGDPGHGAPRLTRAERAELRQLWLAYTENTSPRAFRRAQEQLAGKLQQFLDRGFTLANLAQTMTNENLRVRYGALKAVFVGRATPAAPVG